MKEVQRKYPYTAYLTDNAGEQALFWVDAPNKCHMLNTSPTLTVNIEETRLTPCKIKSVIIGGDS